MWNWTTKKSECRRIDAFELWCWRRLLRVPWTARRSNQSILKEINLEYSLERLMVRLKLRYFGHLMWRADSWKRPWCWERLKQEKGMTEDEMVGWHHWLKVHDFEQALGDGERQGKLACCSPWARKEPDVTERLNQEYESEVNMLVTQSFRLFAMAGTVACQAPLSMEFSRQEYWSGLPFPSPGDLPDARTEPGSPTQQADSLLSEPPGKPLTSITEPKSMRGKIL